MSDAGKHQLFCAACAALLVAIMTYCGAPVLLALGTAVCVAVLDALAQE